MSPASSTCPARGCTSTAATSFSGRRSSTTSATARSSSRSRSTGWCEEGLLAGYRHDGFWLPMDTFKDKQLLEDMYSRGVAPWEVWKNGGASEPIAAEGDDVRPRLRTLPGAGRLKIVRARPSSDRRR